MNDGGVQPRCARAGQPTVSMRAVRALIAAVEQAGVPPASLLHAAGIGAEQLEHTEARLPRADVYRICEFAMELTGDPALGLHWSERLTVKTFAPISYLIAHSASLSDGFASLLQFQRLLSDNPGYELLEHADKVTLGLSIRDVRPLHPRTLPASRGRAESRYRCPSRSVWSLHGSVKTAAEKVAIYKFATNAAGVGHVNNELEIDSD